VKRAARLARRLALGLVLGALAVAAAIVATLRPGDPPLYPPKPGEGIEIVLVNHGWHTGLALSRASLEAEAAKLPGLQALLVRFSGYPWLEIGWGEDAYYRAGPTTSDPHWLLGLRALVRPGNASVLHVVGLDQGPEAMFLSSELVSLRLSPEGLRRLLVRLDGSIATANGRPEELGVGLYGPSLFYRAKGTFSLLRVCNRWTADLLDAAGVPTAPVAATLPRGLIMDLRWRAGATAN
jgi:uncharacterized protein (TIGR02117 family)